ncbi:hypothetical protein JRQ81_002442 [Phrynocephalus forsythii]|uniref:Tyr recombinase domain-containing protein n=1 Tax=Phrynocephalus forsythii TaxID=171643 RepID=A0A9Q0XIX3_9SAUR|nr:hypothetical protein JRQ81_002442 [Phrynocephalus forsythii]
MRGGSKGYLFKHQDGSPLTKYECWKVTSQALAEVRADHLRFGTHSFRIGAASMVAEERYELEEIKCIDRWA